MNSFLNNWSPRALSVLRIIIGFLFLWHGSQKLFGFPTPTKAMEASAFLTFSGILEFGGGILILIGFLTRPVAFILCGMMAVAYFIAHAAGGFLPLANGGELAVIYCFVFLYLFFAGGEVWSIDSLIKKSE